MELVEIAVLIGARHSTRKFEIAHTALCVLRETQTNGLTEVPEAMRQTMSVVDRVVARGWLRNEGLGKYELTQRGFEVLNDAVTDLERIKQEVRRALQ